MGQQHLSRIDAVLGAVVIAAPVVVLRICAP